MGEILTVPQTEVEKSIFEQFLTASSDICDLLDDVQYDPARAMVISGGGVYLYQRMLTGAPERVPTDIDVVIDPSQMNDGMELLSERAGGFLTNVNRIETPRTHHGYVFTNPIVEATSRDGLSVDMLGEMITVFPEHHDLYPGVAYRYPTDNSRLFDLAPMVDIDDDHQIKVAHPGFIAFYKMTMYRNGAGKQDQQDLRRLQSMGLLEPNDELVEVLDILSSGDTYIRDELLRRIADL